MNFILTPHATTTASGDIKFHVEEHPDLEVARVEESGVYSILQPAPPYDNYSNLEAVPTHSSAHSSYDAADFKEIAIRKPEKPTDAAPENKRHKRRKLLIIGSITFGVVVIIVAIVGIVVGTRKPQGDGIKLDPAAAAIQVGPQTTPYPVAPLDSFALGSATAQFDYSYPHVITSADTPGQIRVVASNAEAGRSSKSKLYRDGAWYAFDSEPEAADNLGVQYCNKRWGRMAHVYFNSERNVYERTLCLDWQPGRHEFLSIDNDGMLERQTFANNTSQPEIDRTPTAMRFLQVQPAVATSADSNRVDVFLVGSPNGVLHHTSYDGTEWRGVMGVLGGRVTSRPAAVAWNKGSLNVFVRGANGTLWQKHYNSDVREWVQAESMGGRPIIGEPDVVSLSSGTLNVVAWGADKGYYHRYFDGKRWYPELDRDFERIGEGSGPPRLGVSGKDSVAVFGFANSGDLITRNWTRTALHWGPEANLGRL